MVAFGSYAHQEKSVSLVRKPDNIARLMKGSAITHWKPARLEYPLAPGETSKEPSPDEILTAWREENPDYAPDDVPPDSFVAGFKAARKLANLPFETKTI